MRKEMEIDVGRVGTTRLYLDGRGKRSRASLPCPDNVSGWDDSITNMLSEHASLQHSPRLTKLRDAPSCSIKSGLITTLHPLRNKKDKLLTEFGSLTTDNSPTP